MKSCLMRQERELCPLQGIWSWETGSVTPSGTPGTAIGMVMTLYLADISDFGNLQDAFRKVKASCNWKHSIHDYESNLMENLVMLRRELLDCSYAPSPTHDFIINERGKIRHIKALSVRDRVVNRCLCDQVLVPVLSRKLIYDNGASLKGKGIGFTRRRFQCHLERHIRKHGVNGYILECDYSDFFGSIPHDLCVGQMLDVLRRYGDDSVDWLVKRLIDSNPTGKGVGIGAQISQVVGIFYPYRVDDLCKTVLRLKNYDRYMDDIRVISNDRQELEYALSAIEDESRRLRLSLNPRKTRTTKLTDPFTFLQTRYRVTGSGHIVKKPGKKAVKRERHKLWAYKTLVDSGRMSGQAMLGCYKSWRGNMLWYDCHDVLTRVDALCEEIYHG